MGIVTEPNEALSLLQDSARDLLRRTNSLARLRRLRDAEPRFEHSMWVQLAEAGWCSILVSEERGGLGLGMREVAAIAEEVGRYLMPEPFVAAGVQTVAALSRLAESVLSSRLLERVLSGEHMIGLAWQEQPGELESAVPSLVARSSGGEVSLSGHKQFVVPGTGADGWLACASDAAGPALYWIPARLPGIGVVEESRIDGTTMAAVHLANVSVPASNRLASGEAALGVIAYANDVARIAQGAELLGVARRALEITLEYLGTRVQFGKPIGSFQALQHRMVDAYIHTELAAACIEDALNAIDRGQTTLAAAASRIKARCAHTALLVTRLAIQFHGAIGYTDECDVGLYFKRALALSGWLGDATAHRQRFFASQPISAKSVKSQLTVTEFPREADWEQMSEDEFRALVRAFLEKHYPQALRYPPRRLYWREIKPWYVTLAKQGWLAPAWPRQFGGMALPPDKLLAFFEEFEHHGVARTPDQGLITIGPVLIRFGTKDQRDRFLPKIISGEHIWCQGYSEPNAGSDLASLKTEAVLEGDQFIVNGQKIWTTLAQDATHIYLLVRTDKSVKKQEGISFLLVDLASPGITVRPIRNIAGHEEFCEVFFDKVRVPRANLVGELNQGWTIAKALLGFERIFVGSPQQSLYALKQVEILAKARDLFADPAFVARYAELALDVADLEAAYSHFADIVKRGEALPPNVSLLKIWATETYSRISMLLVEAANEHGASFGAAQFDGVGVNPLAPLLNATITTIYSGTNEIQRNILAKQVLRMPS
jgi:alkylation response protein AidB-like acyl-CoA dehydrogenase